MRGHLVAARIVDRLLHQGQAQLQLVAGLVEVGNLRHDLDLGALPDRAGRELALAGSSSRGLSGGGEVVVVVLGLVDGAAAAGAGPAVEQDGRRAARPPGRNTWPGLRCQDW